MNTKSVQVTVYMNKSIIISFICCTVHMQTYNKYSRNVNILMVRPYRAIYTPTTSPFIDVKLIIVVQRGVSPQRIQILGWLQRVSHYF